MLMIDEWGVGTPLEAPYGWSVTPRGKYWRAVSRSDGKLRGSIEVDPETGSVRVRRFKTYQEAVEFCWKQDDETVQQAPRALVE
jgi:hypothetical protein